MIKVDLITGFLGSGKTTFMKKYAESDGSDPGIFTDYADYVNKYATFCADFEQWENEDLNAAETAYYLEVQARVAEKLLTVNQ